MMDELNPAQRLQLDALDEEYRQRHGVAVALLKKEVGKGDEYANEAARAVISPNGAWFECIDLPMEFSGAAGAPVTHRFVSDSAVTTLLDRLYAFSQHVTPDNTREFGLFVLYSRAGIVDGRGIYAFQHSRSESGMTGKPQRVGSYQPGVLPLVFRCRLDTDLPTEEALSDLAMQRGAIFCLAHVGEKNLLVPIPYEVADGGYVHDLAQTASDPMTQ